MSFYRIIDDLHKPDRWFLGSIDFRDSSDMWKYTKANQIEAPDYPLFIDLKTKGKSLDMTMANFELLIISKKLKTLLPQEGVQTIPVSIKGGDYQDYYALIINNEVDCIDKEKSSYDIWEVNNSIRPDKAGQFKTIYKLVVKDNLKTQYPIFRIKGYNSMIIINRELKKVFEKNDVSGILYKDVCSQ